MYMTLPIITYTKSYYLYPLDCNLHNQLGKIADFTYYFSWKFHIHSLASFI